EFKHLFAALHEIVIDSTKTLLPLTGYNPFRRKTSGQLLDSVTVISVQQIPGVGRVKALTLMQNFSSLKEISNASPAELEPIVGEGSAQQIHSFFHGNLITGT
uniref:DisA/LigA helix-hairpin-helix motif domain-containing protein n=1 Tax=Poecilia mexicana TaxID=48701 RepID=A0A3B3YAA3_9TELE